MTGTSWILSCWKEYNCLGVGNDDHLKVKEPVNFINLEKQIQILLNKCGSIEINHECGTHQQNS